MEQRLPAHVRRLIDKGVIIPNPYSVEIGDDIDVEKISGHGTVFHSGTKLFGAKTLICSGVKLGAEAPVTITNCQLGPDVELKGGFFKGSVFLDRANMGSGAQIREACILEEEANGAHTVGLKQTILFPFVTLGSLINFCDCFMAGGTSRKNHSEVGSSYIHFNYTPNQDKATASLIGDVPRGVMLNQQPIFLGGQGGLVGPTRIGYGTVIAAGTIYRRDCPEGATLIEGCERGVEEKPFHAGFYGSIESRLSNNILYIAHLLALQAWYIHVRKHFFTGREFGAAIYEGALEKLDMAVAERIKRFEALADKMEQSIEISERILSGAKKERQIAQQQAFRTGWPQIKESLANVDPENRVSKEREVFFSKIEDRIVDAENYITFIQSLDNEAVTAGTAWLQTFVDGVAGEAIQSLNSAHFNELTLII